MELLAKQSLKGRIRSTSCLTGHIALGVVEDNARVIILEDEGGNRVAAYLSDEEVTLTATANDIRAGSVAVTNSGVTTGEKVIPSYNTSEASKLILPGHSFEIGFQADYLYDYTKLMAIICPFNKSLKDSVAAEKTAINDSVYPVQSAEVISNIVKDDSEKIISFGISNDTNTVYVLRYFTYKEIY